MTPVRPSPRGRSLLAAVLTGALAAGAVQVVAPLDARAQENEGLPMSEQLGLIRDRIEAGDVLLSQAQEAIGQHRYVRARELAGQILELDPESPVGHGTLGIVLHRAEGSLPRALYHLNRSLDLFESRYGPARFSAFRGWHLMILQETAQLNGAMGHNKEKLELLEKIEQESELPVDADRGWPLMRLRRYEDARDSVERALANGPGLFFDQRVTAYNAICAIEGEQQHRAETYLACLRSAEFDRERGQGDPVAYTNAAIGALAVLKLDEAERLILEGADHFAIGTVSNPWLDLMVLYLAQGRMSEALDSMRKMFDWRNSQPPYMDEQNRAQTEVASALFLLTAGRPFEAARIARRALDRPDRTGYTSSDSEQMESAAALVYTVACRTAAQIRLEESAAASSWLESLELRYEAFRLDLTAWSAERRAAALLAADRILISTVRPYLPGGSEIAEWIQLELPRLLGPGIVSAAVERAREVETLDSAEGYFSAFEAQIAREQGDAEGTLRPVEQALATLPRRESMIQARMAALGAEAAWDLGRADKAYGYFSRALQVDPGVLRRLGIALPTRFRVGDSSAAQEAAERLRASPRFTEGVGFVVKVDAQGSEGNACLLGQQGEVFACASAVLTAGDEDDDLAAKLAGELHAVAFAPRIDLTQSDIRSLDGSPTAAGGRSKERMKIILDNLVGPAGSD